MENHTKAGKLIIISAPSGSGKSSIIHYLLQQGLPLQFSISATSRAPRGKEQDGVDYYFLTPEEFRSRIENGDFLEYEEVYKDTFYGTPKNEVERITKAGKHVLFDIDVVGGCNIKTSCGDRALSLFIQPPSIRELRRRLKQRGTDTPEMIEKRLEKAAYELSFAPKFDATIVNDDLAIAQDKVLQIVRDFINSTGPFPPKPLTSVLQG
jgi:guanylate kinase